MNERDRLEQEALAALNNNNPEAALRAWLNLLKQDPKDRRLRQRVGELSIKVGRIADGEKHLKEVADAYLKEENRRAAAAVLKQLVTVRPDEPSYHVALAEAYFDSNYVNDARQHFEAAVQLHVQAQKPLLAAAPQARLADLSPGEPVLRLKVAEFYEAGKDTDRAFRVYEEVITEFQRRGRPDEVGRVAELALKLRPDDIGMLVHAANARVDATDWKKALVHLQLAFSQKQTDTRVLDLLARAFEGIGQKEKALKVLLELARLSEQRQEFPQEAAALRRASTLSPNDTELSGRLRAAEDRLERLERRITSLEFAQPADEAELRPVVRAEVFLKYGFPDKAEAAVRESAAVAERTSVLASLAEALAAGGKRADAIRIMERLTPRAGVDLTALRERISVLTSLLGETAEDLAAVEPEDELVEDELPTEETLEQRGDRLYAAGDRVGAMAAWREALEEDPLNDAVLEKIAAARTAGRAPSGAAAVSAPTASPAPVAVPKAAPAPPPIDIAVDDVDDLVDDELPLPDAAPPPTPSPSPPAPRAVPAPAPPAPPAPAPAAVAAAAASGPQDDEDDAFARLLAEDGGFGSLDAEDGPIALDPHADARLLVAAGLYADAGDLLDSPIDLEGNILAAHCARGVGALDRAIDILRRATNDADENDPMWPVALFDLSGLYAATRQYRPALMLIEELTEDHPNFRRDDVLTRQRALERFIG